MQGPTPGVPVNLDGTERRFRLTFGALRRLKDKHKIDLLAMDVDAISSEPIDFLGAILFECMQPRPKDIDEFLDNIDLRDAGKIAGIINEAMGTAVPNPTLAAPVADAADSDSPNSGRSPDTTSEFQLSNSGS